MHRPRSSLASAIILGIAGMAGAAAIAAPDIASPYEFDGRSYGGKGSVPHRKSGAAKIKREAKKKRRKR